MILRGLDYILHLKKKIPVKEAEDNVEDNLVKNVVTQDDELPESPKKK